MARKIGQSAPIDDGDDRVLSGPRQRAATHTSSFGVSKRESHDSSVYYNSKMHAELATEHDTGVSQPLPIELEDSVICGDSRNLLQIPNN